MAQIPPSVKLNTGTLMKFVKVNKRHLQSSRICVSIEKKDAPPLHHSAKSEMAVGSPTTILHQTHQTSKYEPTLIGSPVSKTLQKEITPTTTHHGTLSQNNTSAEMQCLRKDTLDSFLDHVDPTTVNRVYYFDTLAFTKKLEAKGFSRDQAEGCVECLLEIIGNTLNHQAKHMITKSEQKIAEHLLHTEVTSVKKDMVLLQKSEFSALRTETEKIGIDIARIQSHFDDEIVKLKGQFTLDINLERGRAVEAHAANEKRVQMLDNKIETEIAHLKTTYEVYRNDIFKYAAGTVLTCTTLIIGFIRLWK